MITVLTWLWTQPRYRSNFTAEHVNTLQRMVARNLKTPHRFVCMTNEAGNFAPGVEVVPITLIPDVAVPEGRPNCFRRLWAWSTDVEGVLGMTSDDYLLCLDLDCVITGALDSLLDTSIDFRMWGDTARKTQYNGSMVWMRVGARKQVWDEFIKNPGDAWTKTRHSGLIGSDQAWITLMLGRGEAMWTDKDGVYSFRNQIAPRPRRDLPANAKIVFFHGLPDPWHVPVQRDYPWIKAHYR
jgi:hypothetical protein